MFLVKGKNISDSRSAEDESTTSQKEKEKEEENLNPDVWEEESLNSDVWEEESLNSDVWEEESLNSDISLEESLNSEVSEVFVRMEESIEDDGKVGYVWYKLLKTDEEETSIVSPCFKLTQPDCHYQSTQVAVGPFLLLIGGTNFPKAACRSKKMYRDVYYIDTRNPNAEGWKKGPSILSRRKGGYAFVLGNNSICILGGIATHPYGEVFNLKKGIWKFFRTSFRNKIPPPLDIYAHSLLFVEDIVDSDKEFRNGLFPDNNMICENVWYKPDECDPLPKRLHLHGSNALYCYDFDTSLWELVSKPTSHCTSTTCNNIFYLFGSQLDGFSIRWRRWFPVSVSVSDIHKFPPPTDSHDAKGSTPPRLVHLGNGIICILWARCSPSAANLHCTKFTVKARMCENGEIAGAATVKSFNTYKLPPGTMIDCVAVCSPSAANLHCTKFTVKARMCENGEIAGAATVKSFNTYKLPPGTMIDCVAVSTSSSITLPFVE